MELPSPTLNQEFVTQSNSSMQSSRETKHIETCSTHDVIRSHGFPQYEDEVFCVDTDIPSDFWTGLSANENLLS